MNQFLSAATQRDTFTENGAISNSSTGDVFLNYFSNAGAYRGRLQEDVDADVSRMWGQDPVTTMQMLFYLRMITRKPNGFLESESVQNGQGNRDEFRKGLNWIARYHEAYLIPNLWLVPVVGTWKDLWHEDLIDVLPTDRVYELIQQGISDSYNRDLLSKYLPRIRSRSNTKNDRHRALNTFARGLCSYLGWSEKQYRQFKSNGNAHQFQQCMSKGLWNQIDFNRISGKALLQLVTNTGKDGKTTIQRHGLEQKYLNWIQTQPVAKFNGHVHELTAKAKNLSKAQKFTLDKQFEGLLQTTRENEGGLSGNVWCALDTSGSMTWAPNTALIGATPYDICIGLGIFFSSLNTGAFKDNVIMFDNNSRKLKLSGTFTDKLNQIQRTNTAWGSTNFQSVIDEIVRIRTQNPDIPVEDYPETLLVVSDMQFDPSGSATTNYNRAMRKLADVGLPNIRVVWWDVTGRKEDFPSTMEDEGTILISGFDGSIITLLLGGDQYVEDPTTGQKRALTPIEQMNKALSQELLLQVK